MESRSCIVAALKLHLLSSGKQSGRKGVHCLGALVQNRAQRGCTLIWPLPGRQTGVSFKYTCQRRISVWIITSLYPKFPVDYKDRETSDLRLAGDFCAHILLYRWRTRFCSVFQTQHTWKLLIARSRQNYFIASHPPFWRLTVDRTPWKCRGDWKSSKWPEKTVHVDLHALPLLLLRRVSAHTLAFAAKKFF